MSVRNYAASQQQAGESLAGRATLKPKATYVVHGGDGTWPMPGDITAISVASLMERLPETGSRDAHGRAPVL